jgi:hypothetical protein
MLTAQRAPVSIHYLYPSPWRLCKESRHGEGGIRTLERLAPLHAFQACQFSRSCTSPYTLYFLLSTFNFQLLRAIRPAGAPANLTYTASGIFSPPGS